MTDRHKMFYAKCLKCTECNHYLTGQVHLSSYLPWYTAKVICLIHNSWENVWFQAKLNLNRTSGFQLNYQKYDRADFKKIPLSTLNCGQDVIVAHGSGADSPQFLTNVFVFMGWHYRAQLHRPTDTDNYSTTKILQISVKLVRVLNRLITVSQIYVTFSWGLKRAGKVLLT